MCGDGKKPETQYDESEAEDDGPLTPFRVLLDDETVAMLIELSEACHCEPTVLAASLLRGVLVDDIEAHGGEDAMIVPPMRLHS